MVNHRDGDQALIQRAQAGDAQAVAKLYEGYAPAIFRYLYGRVSIRAVAEDLTAEVFLKMVEGLPRYVDRGLPIGAWLFRIAHDRLVDYFRRSSQRQHEPLSEMLVDETDGTETAALRQVEVRTLFALFNGLTDEQRLVLQLRFIEGYSLEYTAGLMQKTIGAVKALQFRALRHLAGQLQAEV